MELGQLVGFALGLVQGYLAYPTLMWSGPLTTKALSPWKAEKLRFTGDLCTVIVLVFLASAHFAVTVSVQSLMRSPSLFGRWWSLGLFAGICVYVLVPAVETRMRRKD